MKPSPSPNAGRMVALDLRVCAGLGKRPGESLLEAARRVLRGKRGRRVRMAAHVLLGPGSPWLRMVRADRWLA